MRLRRNALTNCLAQSRENEASVAPSAIAHVRVRAERRRACLGKHASSYSLSEFPSLGSQKAPISAFTTFVSPKSTWTCSDIEELDYSNQISIKNESFASLRNVESILSSDVEHDRC